MAPVSVLAFDLDHFKSINDRFGHAVGDAVLQLFAKVVRKTMRANDIIGRLGGEEFVAILPGTLAEAAIAAERVRAAFAAAGACSGRPANSGDGQHRRGLRPAGRRDRHAHRPRRRRALPRQGERTQPGRDRPTRWSTAAPEAGRRPAATPRGASGRRNEQGAGTCDATGTLHRLARCRKRKGRRRRPLSLHRVAMQGGYSRSTLTPSSTFRTRPDAACARSG